jgi:DNA polymerase theta
MIHGRETAIETVCQTLGLPTQIGAAYARLGITQLYAWQAECVAVEQVLQGENLLYTAPTSGGKTLVAEVSRL